MPVSDEKHLWVTNEQYHHLIEEVAVKVAKSGWKFDQILCLARGGVRPGDIMSRIFDIPLSIMTTSSYREDAGKTQGKLTIGNGIAGTKPGLAGNVLLVDDLLDSGVTMQKVLAYLKETYPEVKEIRSAVLWVKGCSVMQPDYFAQFLPTSPWIHQPFEKYDDMTIDALMQAHPAD